MLSFGVVLLLAGGGGGPAPDRPGAPGGLPLGGPPSGPHTRAHLAVRRGFHEGGGSDLTPNRAGDGATHPRTGRGQAAILPRPLPGTVCVMAFVPGGPYLCVLETTLQDRRSEVAALVRALQRGYLEAGVDPESAIQA